MSALTMTRPESSSSNPKYRDATPQEIIAQARSAPPSAKGAFLASGLTALLMWASFTPVDFGPLGWICLIPILVLTRIPRPTRWMYRALYLGGLAFWGASLQWMRLGDPTMYVAWIALAVYLAVYYPLFVGLARLAHLRCGAPLVLAAPVIWTGLEFLRNHLLTGFGWYELGHSQYRWIEIIQICDLVGVYGVSFLMVLMSACAVELISDNWIARFGILPHSSMAAATKADPLPVSRFGGRLLRVAVCLTVFGTALGYGFVRRSQANFQPGPRVAMVQGNVPTSLKHDPDDWPRIHQRHMSLTGIAVRQQPDLIVWPETMFRWPLLDTPLGVSDQQLQESHPQLPVDRLRNLGVRKKLSDMSQMAGAGLVIGIETIAADKESVRTYNSAVFVRPDAGTSGRYDKIHRVIFGEYIPLSDYMPWLVRFTPFAAGFGLQAGQESAAFDYKGYRYSPIICFEDTIPDLVRNIVNYASEKAPAKRVDVLVNLTNDGWFHGSSELDQHLITAAFRSVECRLPMVRAVNTGISACIDGDGVIRKRAVDIKAADSKMGASKEVEAVVVDTVPLDSRRSLYLLWGDWFAGGCLVACAGLAGVGLLSRWFPRRNALASV